jgi:hypothetical protein
MKLKLSSDDRCAIDLVLEERAAAGSNLEHCFGKPTAALQKRVRAVERVLDVLGQWPAQEPPGDLANRTMKFIGRHAHESVPVPAASRRPASVSHASAQQRSLQ